MAISTAGGFSSDGTNFVRWRITYDTDTRDLTLLCSGTGTLIINLREVDRPNGDPGDLRTYDVTQYLNQGTQVFPNVNLKTRGARTDGLNSFAGITSEWTPPSTE